MLRTLSFVISVAMGWVVYAPVTLSATTGCDKSTLTVVGSQIDAGSLTTLKADGAVNLLAAENTGTQHGTNSSSGWSVGVGFSLGSSNGFTIDLAANRALGKEDGTSNTWTNTHVTAGCRSAPDPLSPDLSRLLPRWTRLSFTSGAMRPLLSARRTALQMAQTNVEPFKHFFSLALVQCIADHLQRQLTGFDHPAFVSSIGRQLDALELKARAQLIADHVHAALPVDPLKRERALLATLHPDELEHANQPANDEGICGWGILPLALVVGQHGVADFDRSMHLLREMTKRFSSEFAIRYLLLADQHRATSILATWVHDPNHHVRRLVSEGIRPRLPWAMQLPELKRDPSPMLPLLEQLRDDVSLYVRRSVANHLNDIAKDHPDLITSLALDWRRGASPEREALLRHACRGLIKQGHAATLAVFDRHPPQLKNGALRLSTPSLRMGEVLEIQMTLCSTAKVPQQLTIDYVLHLLKANGQRSPKVFKGALMTLAPGESITFCRSHRFREVTTRRHYPGQQGVCLRINGIDTEVVGFGLQD